MKTFGTGIIVEVRSGAPQGVSLLDYNPTDITGYWYKLKDDETGEVAWFCESELSKILEN